MNKTIEGNLKRAARKVQEQGYHPVFISLHGSQNYGLEIFTDDYQSDYDYKCIVLPTLWDLVKNSKPVSTVHDFEGGHIDIKDIRVFMDTVIKMNPSYLEVLITPYSIFLEGGELVWNMKGFVSDLIRQRGMLFAKACYGMFLEKEKAMCHPYPTIAHKIEKYGYDGKQTHHMYRLLLMLRDFERTEEMILCPPEEEKAFLIDLKLNHYTLDEVQIMVEKWKIEMMEIRSRLEIKYNTVKSDAADMMINMSRNAVFNFCCTQRGKGSR